jgi:hypothetical protein
MFSILNLVYIYQTTKEGGCRERQDARGTMQNKMLQVGIGVQQEEGKELTRNQKGKIVERGRVLKNVRPSTSIKQNSRRRRIHKHLRNCSLCKFVHSHITAPSLIPNVVRGRCFEVVISPG